MDQELLSPDAWSGLLGSLPAGLDLEASARERRAWRRARGVRSAADLLRLALACANTPLSLRGTAAWATAAGVADLSDVALLYRLMLKVGSRGSWRPCSRPASRPRPASADPSRSSTRPISRPPAAGTARPGGCTP